MALKDKKIGFIGLGAMGKGMAARCVKKEFYLVVHDICPEPVAELVWLGASEGKSIQAIAEACKMILTELPKGREVNEIVMGPDGIFAHAQPGTLVVHLSTIDLETTDKLHDTS